MLRVSRNYRISKLPGYHQAMFRIPRLNAILAAALLLSFAARAQDVRRAPALIRSSIDESRLVTLGGNTRPEAIAANDLGAVPGNFALNHMLLQLKRAPQMEASVEQLITRLHDPKSPNFHRWLSAAEFGENYGLAQSDIDTITGWLESHGFAVNSIYPGGTVIDFSGTAGQVHAAFHTAIHKLSVKGVRHIANFSDPQIPEALAPAVAGIVSLHDFRPHQMSRARSTPSRPRATRPGLSFPRISPPSTITIRCSARASPVRARPSP